ncbi:MAG: hypothetical protein ABSB49_19700 [Polyangia bacterium]|jgi:hypothetical protein
MKSPPPEKGSSAAKPRRRSNDSPAPVATRADLKVAFPKKNRPPSAAAFTAHLPLALGKRLELARSFLLRQKDVKEDIYFYGPKTGWALRYLSKEQPLCALLLHGGAPVAIVALPAAAAAAVNWKTLSPAGQLAHKNAHGSPALLWLDIPLAGAGAADFKAIVRVKLAAQAASAP